MITAPQTQQTEQDREEAARVARDIARLENELALLHVGLENAITIAGLATVMGLSKRAMEHFLERHIGELRMPVVVDTQRGVFVPTEAGQINAYLDSLDSRQRRVHLRKRAVVRRCLAAGWQRLGKRFVDGHPQPEVALVIP